ncbi:MAG: trehalose-phosphatase [Gammaproteobacteria bacterium]|nr:trehalose-phosphatase [Gammaproteobacteria bacterium]
MSVCPESIPPKACLFLDFDGTLVDFAPDPQSVLVTPDLLCLLATLTQRFEGALALVTGRALGDVDGLIRPLQLPVAALHGTVRRDAKGTTLIGTNASIGEFAASSRRIREHFQYWVDQQPGVMLEDKGLALALHFRGARSRWTPTRDDLAELESILPPELELICGALVVEVRCRGDDKGTAVEAFLNEAPFRDRVPIYIGDDVADARAIEVVERRGGIAIAVGDRIDARFHFPDPSALRHWLTHLAFGRESP